MCKFILNHELEAWRPVLHAIRELPEEYHWKWSELRELLLEEALGYLEHEFEACRDFSVVVPLQRMKYEMRHSRDQPLQQALPRMCSIRGIPGTAPSILPIHIRSFGRNIHLSA